MTFVSKYTARIPDATGHIHYTAEDDAVWKRLYERQMGIVKDRASDVFMLGLQRLDMPVDHVPQCEEMNKRLSALTGWRVKPVAAIIPDEEYFDLLAHKYFPAASFIRLLEELDYLQEPDIFHEFYGHCPMLTDPICADFQERYGKLALKASAADRVQLMRLYWFTIEFGLIQESAGLRVYGGGILSSAAETVSSLIDPKALRVPFEDGLPAMRTPYRFDMVQPLYYVLNSFDQLYQLLHGDLLGLVHKAQDLGDFEPAFPPLSTQSTQAVC